MFNRSNSTKTPMVNRANDSLETENATSLKGFGSSLVDNTTQSFKDLGTGMFDQLFGLDKTNKSADLSNDFSQQSNEYQKGYEDALKQQENKPVLPDRKTLYSFGEQQEQQQMAEIRELIKAIKQEVDAIKRADSAMMGEVRDIEKLTLDSVPAKAGIYHVRFLELVLKVLQTLRAKLSESSTWMEALHSKKAKQGSAFAARSKKSGTQYSMSEEHKIVRNTQ